MPNSSKALKVATLVLFSLTLFVFVLLKDANVFLDATDYGNYECQIKKDVQGPEDIAALGDGLIVSSFIEDKRQREMRRGTLYFLDKLDNFTNISPNLNFEFNPHGLDVYKLPNGDSKVVVINHRTSFDSIEVFLWSKNQKTLSHTASIMSEELYNANDIALVSEQRFFVTLDHGAKTHFWKMVERFARLKRGKVLFFNGNNFIVKNDQISYANGIAYNSVDKKLYVASMTGKKVIEFSSAENGDLKKSKEWLLDTFPDNITLQDGYLWIASHVKILALKKHAENHQNISPFRILKLNLHSQELTKVYEQTGKFISAVSTAFPQGEKLYLGNIFEQSFAICRRGEIKRK